ncbi:SMI1/KNR4 family protein [Pirellulaceae bacterium SH449]
MNGFKKLLSVMKTFERLGRRDYKNGAIGIGKAPHFGKQAYLHDLMPPCSENQIREIECKLNASLPTGYRKFLLKHNGLGLFHDTLSIFGYKDWNHPPAGQPYDVLTPNTLERPDWLSDGELIIGSYNWDGSFVVVSKVGNVSVREPDEGSVLCSWDSLDEFFAVEAARLPNHFDADGRYVDEDSSTVPSCN